MTSLQEEDIQRLDEYHVLSLLEECKETLHRLNREITAQYRQKHLLEERIIALRSPTSPVNRMPDELMLDIFERAKCNDSFALGTILLVCRKWYQLAINSPFLWADIKIDFEYTADVTVIKGGQQYVEAAIRYSQQAPLHISVALPDLYPLIRQTSLNLLGFEDEDLDDDDDDNQGRYDTVYEWMMGAVASDPPALILYKDVTNAISEFTTAIVGSNGVNLLRLRSFKVNYDPNYFNDWLLDGVFHHPTPVLEELTIRMQDGDHLGLELDPIFLSPPPSLSRLSTDAIYPLDNLLDSNSVVNSLFLNFSLVNLEAFPNQALLRNLTYLCICSFNFNQSSGRTNQDILLPSLEDLTLRGTYVANCVKAPRLATLRIFLHRNFNFDPAHMPYFPSLRKLHWLYGEEEVKSESLREYLDQHPFIGEMALLHSDEGLVKRFVTQLRDDLRDRKLVFKGYRIVPGSDQLWSWSAPFPYESNEIYMD